MDEDHSTHRTVLTFERAVHHAARCRLSQVRGVDGIQTWAGAGWVAIRSGLGSNDLNGVLSAPGHRPDAALLTQVGSWFGSTTATWYLADADDKFPDVAVRGGWQPEHDARCAGRALPLPTVTVPAGFTLRMVSDETGTDAWLDVAQACGWFDVGERDRRSVLARALPWPRWVSCRNGQPVGMATGWRDGDVAELVDVAVLPSAGRRGVGAALVSAVAAWAGPAVSLVAEPSSDGWALLRSLGFQNVSALPNTVAYWPG